MANPQRPADPFAGEDAKIEEEQPLDVEDEDEDDDEDGWDDDDDGGVDYFDPSLVAPGGGKKEEEPEEKGGFNFSFGQARSASTPMDDPYRDAALPVDDDEPGFMQSFSAAMGGGSRGGSEGSGGASYSQQMSTEVHAPLLAHLGDRSAWHQIRVEAENQYGERSGLGNLPADATDAHLIARNQGDPGKFYLTPIDKNGYPVYPNRQPEPLLISEKHPAVVALRKQSAQGQTPAVGAAYPQFGNQDILAMLHQSFDSTSREKVELKREASDAMRLAMEANEKASQVREQATRELLAVQMAQQEQGGRMTEKAMQPVFSMLTSVAEQAKRDADMRLTQMREEAKLERERIQLEAAAHRAEIEAKRAADQLRYEREREEAREERRRTEAREERRRDEERQRMEMFAERERKQAEAQSQFLITQMQSFMTMQMGLQEKSREEERRRLDEREKDRERATQERQRYQDSLVKMRLAQDPTAQLSALGFDYKEMIKERIEGKKEEKSSWDRVFDALPMIFEAATSMFVPGDDPQDVAARLADPPTMPGYHQLADGSRVPIDPTQIEQQAPQQQVPQALPDHIGWSVDGIPREHAVAAIQQASTQGYQPVMEGNTVIGFQQQAPQQQAPQQDGWVIEHGANGGQVAPPEPQMDQTAPVAQPEGPPAGSSAYSTLTSLLAALRKQPQSRWKLIIMARLANAEDVLALLRSVTLTAACAQIGATPQEAQFIVGEIRQILQSASTPVALRTVLESILLE